MRLLDIIAHANKLKVLCGDIGNAFVTAPCLEKVYSTAGQEFGQREGSVLVIKKALYGLRSSSRAFRQYFAEYIRGLGFKPVRFDRDVWMRLRDTKDGYDYLCTHVDDFKIVAKNPTHWMTKIQAKFVLKSVGPPSYYLGTNYNWSEQEKAWVVGCQTFCKEIIQRVEQDLIKGQLYPHKIPLPADCHPELDDSPLLDDGKTKMYQQLIGMLQWACTVGRLDICFAVSSLSRFSANPREHHLELALHVMGYLKKNPNRRIVIDSRPLKVDPDLQKQVFQPDFLNDYPDAEEEIPSDLPTAYGPNLETSIFVDSDFAHDIITRRSVTGIIQFVGSTPVAWSAKRQGCIATFTYCAEFIAMRTASEEAVSLRYMLRCLGVPVPKDKPTNIFGDNWSVIQSATIPESEMKKKHIAILYLYVRETIAAGVSNPVWIRTYENFSDVCTKALCGTTFDSHIHELMA